jgi:polysaccharide export outer membrane protein
MRVCRFLVLLLAVAALAACARRPPPYYAASPYQPAPHTRADLDAMVYGAPAPYRTPPSGYRPAYRPSYPPPAYYPPPTAYRPVPPPSYTVRTATRYVPAPVLPGDSGPYTLDTGDKLRVVVFGQDTLSNTYLVDAAGMISMPLIGAVTARDQTTATLAASIKSRLAQGYIREPSVAVEVEIHRPFFVLGEVTYPGQYPYVPHMTVENAVAIAGGFTPRASKSKVTVTRKVQGMPARFALPLRANIRPGDVLTVAERWF